ncbi:MAG: Hsp33 family molecular chaperone HslO [Clostridia bacterium]|nr:Hsp33 family molecular chaperone HslO [Clostridia bacterium]
MDKLLKTLIFDDQISLSILETTDMVNKAIEYHSLSPVCAAALGRTLTVCTFMSQGLKNQKDKLSVTVSGNGPIGKITVCGNGDLQMRGYVDNPQVDLPLNSKGKLDVGGCVGKNGRITVIKSMGLKDPYSGSCQLVSGEIAEDFTAYYAFSEQQPTAIALGVKIGTDGKCVGAGGVIVQALPFAQTENLIKAEEIIKNLTNLSTLIENGSAEEILKTYFGDLKYTEYHPKYECICSKEYLEKILISLGKEELCDIVQKEGSVKVTCEFCRKEYEFTQEDVDRLFN